MNLLKKGPDLKLGDVKVPGFLRDVYDDLRDRHLLPLIALLVVALVATPILLSNGSEFEEITPGVVAPAPATRPAVIVAKATPGLRIYQKRFAGQAARNPFGQQPAEGSSGGGSPGEAPTEATVESSASGSAEPVPSPESSPSGEGGSGGAPAEEPNPKQLTYYSWAIDVSVASGTGKDKSEPVVRRNQAEYTSFPSNKVPALTFIGVTKDEKRAVMLVSDKVTGLFGEATCVRGSEHCQLLAMEPNFPITVVYGSDERTYRIELRKIRLITTDKLNRAPLGKNEGGKGEGKGSGRAKGFSRQTPILPGSAQISLDQLTPGE